MDKLPQGLLGCFFKEEAQDMQEGQRAELKTERF